MKKIYYLMMVAALSVMMVSCSDWDSPYYVDDITGRWVTEYGCDVYGTYPLTGFDAVWYDFYGNHMGRYTFYDEYTYILCYVDFEWETRGNRLFIRYYDGDFDNLYYGYDDYGYLVLSTDRYFHEYTVYRPAGLYYEPDKSLTQDSNDSLHKETSTDKVKVKSVTRAIKARVTEAE